MLFSACATNDEIAQDYINFAAGYTGLDAVRIYERGLEESDAFSLYYNLAYSYLEAGDFEKAAETADEALEIYPDSLRFLYLRAYALREEGRIYSYELALKDILERDPGNDDVRQMLLDHYMKTGRRRDAEDIAREIILYDPENQNALRALAQSSAFFAAIAPAANTESSVQDEKKGWTVPPQLYMPLGVFNGDRMPTP